MEESTVVEYKEGLAIVGYWNYLAPSMMNMTTNLTVNIDFSGRYK